MTLKLTVLRGLTVLSAVPPQVWRAQVLMRAYAFIIAYFLLFGKCLGCCLLLHFGIELIDRRC